MSLLRKPKATLVQGDAGPFLPKSFLAGGFVCRVLGCVVHAGKSPGAPSWTGAYQ